MITVLLADDQPVVRAGLATMLSAEPDLLVVGEAADGRAAVELVRTVSADVILMDIRMPDLDGISATELLVRSGTTCRVCILTTYGVDEYVYDALAAGASGFLLKTDSPQRIVATIRSIAEGEFALGTETTRRLVDHFMGRARPDPASLDLLATLTAREREVLLLVADGLSNAEIAKRLYVSEGTAKTHVARILMKLGLRDRVQVVVYAHRNGISA